MGAPGALLNLRDHANYKPDLGALAREQISASRRALGCPREEFADRLTELLGWTVDAELIASWETRDVSPPPGDALVAAGMLARHATHDLDEHGTVVDHMLGARLIDVTAVYANQSDLIKVHASRGLVTRPEWNGIITGATRELWLYGMAELGYALDDAVPDILSDTCRNGGRVRILLLNPASPTVDLIDEDEGNPAGTLATRIRAALSRFRCMAAGLAPAMQVRLYSSVPTVSIVRGDGRMLVTPYMRFFIGSNSPTYEMQQVESSGPFDRYARHFEAIWNSAEEIKV